MILRSKPSAMSRRVLFGIGAVDRVDEQRLAVRRDVDRQRARRQRDQIGEQRDLEIAVDLQRIGEDARLQVHARRQHQPRDAIGRKHQFVDETARPAGRSRSGRIAISLRRRCSRAKDEAQGAERKAEQRVGDGERAGEREPGQRQQQDADASSSWRRSAERPRRHSATDRSARPPRFSAAAMNGSG